MPTSLNSAKVWVVATPLGNPGDLSPRAREVLETADLILAEDTRRTGLLCSRCGVSLRGRFISLHDHNESERAEGLASLIRDEKLVAALVSDAGTPLMSDPGYRLVRACLDAGISVSPVPGPSAVLAALSASGLPPQPFVFLGFPPRKAGDIRTFFRPYATLAATLVFFDRKDRVEQTLEAAHRELGDREVCIARELTKTHEEFIRFRLGDPLPGDLLGEVTCVVGPPLGEARTPVEEVRRLVLELSEGRKPRDAARAVQDVVRGWTGKEIYELLRTSKEHDGG